jgi:hypothetical protein
MNKRGDPPGPTTPALTITLPTEGLSSEKVGQLWEAIGETIRAVLGETPSKALATAVVRGWSPQLFNVFLTHLRSEGAWVQADAIQAAVANGGTIERSRIYEISGWDPKKRTLKGFTRPITRVFEDMKATGLLPSEATPVFRTAYGNSARAKGFFVPAELLPLFGAQGSTQRD